MIEPKEFSPFELVEYMRLGLQEKIFISFGSKYLLYDSSFCVFEILSGPNPQGYYFNSEKKYQSIEDIFSFVGEIRAKYPDVADWFLFNIKKFS
jgi:hypothetical protein